MGGKGIRLVGLHIDQRTARCVEGERLFIEAPLCSHLKRTGVVVTGSVIRDQRSAKAKMPYFINDVQPTVLDKEPADRGDLGWLSVVFGCAGCCTELPTGAAL